MLCCTNIIWLTSPDASAMMMRATSDDSIVGLPQQMASWEAVRAEVRGFWMLIEFHVATECGTLFAFAGVCQFFRRIDSQNGNFE